MDFYPVRLNDKELRVWGLIGLDRRIEMRDRLDKNNMPRKQMWTSDIEGSLKEGAVAKVLEAYPHGAFEFCSRTDVGEFEVRGALEHNHRLIVRASDENKPCIFVTGMLGDYRIWGWIWADEAKRQEWLDDPTGTGRPPEYFVPREALRPLQLKGPDSA